MKKMLPFLLSLLLVCSLIPSAAYATTSDTAEISIGETGNVVALESAQSVAEEPEFEEQEPEEMESEEQESEKLESEGMESDMEESEEQEPEEMESEEQESEELEPEEQESEEQGPEEMEFEEQESEKQKSEEMEPGESEFEEQESEKIESEEQESEEQESEEIESDETESEERESEETEPGESESEEQESENLEVGETNAIMLMAAEIDYVAYIGETGYESLQEAFKAAATDGTQTTISLASDIDLGSGTVTVPAGANVTLYGNGCTISNVGCIQVGNASSGTTTKLSLGSSNGSTTENTLTISGISGNSNAILNVSNSTLDMYTGVTLTGNENKSGGAVAVADGSTFNMYGGLISGNSVSSYGGGVYVDNGTATITGGSITGNSADRGGGICIAVNGTATIAGGSVSENSASSYGGGIYIYNGTASLTSDSIAGNSAPTFGGGVYIYGLSSTGSTGSFYMSGGSITENSSKYGGGIYNRGFGGTVSIDGGSIAKNNATYGGGIYNFSGGTVTMKSCSIVGNTAYDSGGGVYVEDYSYGDSYFIMSSGSITGNSALNGGGVYVSEIRKDYGSYGGQFTMTGGSITGNAAEYAGGGVYIFADSGTNNGAMYVSGNPVITGNTLKSGSANNVYLEQYKYITLIGELTSGAEIGVSVEDVLSTTHRHRRITDEDDDTAYFKTAYRYFTSDVETVGDEIVRVTTDSYYAKLVLEDNFYTYYTVTRNLTNLSANVASKRTVVSGSTYTITLTASDGYILPKSVTVSGSTSYSYDSTTGELTITNVNADITVTASGVAKALSTTEAEVSGTYDSPISEVDLKNSVTYSGDNDPIPTDDIVSFEIKSGSSLPTGLELDTETGIISGTPEEAGDSTVIITVTAKNSQTADITVAIKIAKKEIAKPAEDTAIYTYNGAEQTYVIQESNDYTVSGNTQTNAGIYGVTVVLKDTANTVWAENNNSSDNLTYIFAIGKKEIVKPAEDTTAYTYNGEEQTYVIAESDEYTVSGNMQIDAGTYTVTVALNDTGNTIWADSDNSIADLTYTFIIEKKEIAKPAEDTTTHTYNGEEQTYVIAESDEYSVSENTQIGAGTYDVTVALTDKNNTAWADNNSSSADLTYIFTIAKAGQDVSFTDSKVTKTVGDDNFTIELTGNTVGTITYTSSNEKVAAVNEYGEVTVVGAGNATITAVISGDDNYSEAEISYVLTVSAAESSDSTDDEKSDSDSTTSATDDTNDKESDFDSTANKTDDANDEESDSDSTVNATDDTNDEESDSDSTVNATDDTNDEESDSDSTANGTDDMNDEESDSDSTANATDDTNGEESDSDSTANAMSDADDENTGSATNSASGESTTDNAQTGDDTNILLWVLIMLLAASGITVTAAYGRKRKYNK